MPYSQAFIDSLKFTLRWEGGLSDVKNDRGGLTNYGITQTVYTGYCLHKYSQTKPVTEITKEEAEEIYYDQYWLKAGCPHIVSEKVALCVFDWVVNSGVGGAGKLIQKELKVTADGIIGNGTLSALNTLINLHGELFVAKLLLDARQRNYERLAQNPTQKKFLAGWTNRVNDLSKVVGV